MNLLLTLPYLPVGSTSTKSESSSVSRCVTPFIFSFKLVGCREREREEEENCEEIMCFSVVYEMYIKYLYMK